MLRHVRLAALLLAFSTPSFAGSFMLYVSDNPAAAPGPAGSNTLVCDDNTGGCSGIDWFIGPGKMSWAGSLGVWSFVLTGAISKTIASDPLTMTDMAFQVLSDAPGDLFIWMTDTGFTGPLNLGIGANLGGNGQNGNVTARGWTGGATFATTNALFDCPVIPFSTSNFTCSTTGTTPGSGPFSITERISVHHNAAGVSSGDLLLTSVPEPASLVLLGSGLIGLAAAKRRRLRKAAVEEGTP